MDPRTYLAAERTLLAWVRTGLALMGFGFVVARFGLFLSELALVQQGHVTGRRGSLPIGVTLVGIGVSILVVSAFRYHRYATALKKGEEAAPPGPLFGIIVTVVVALVGVGMMVYLISLV